MGEGYVKYKTNWIKTDGIKEDLEEIQKERSRLYELGLVGAYEGGIGFGNLSIRIKGTDQFIITGTATGNFKKITEKHYAKITDFSIEKNQLTCEGSVKASSESLTHAAIYISDHRINAIIHVHNMKLWQNLIDKVPTTSKDAEYGTPEIANEVIRLFNEGNASDEKIIVMGGHKKGILVFGKTLKEAEKVLLKYRKLY